LAGFNKTANDSPCPEQGIVADEVLRAPHKLRRALLLLVPRCMMEQSIVRGILGASAAAAAAAARDLQEQVDRLGQEVTGWWQRGCLPPRA
jgi:hypothetical protein